MRRDWFWILVLMIFGLIPRLYTLQHTTVASRDCVNFIQLTLNLDDPRNTVGERVSRLDILRKAEHPPGYSVALLGMAYTVRGTTTLGPDDWMRIGQYVSIVAGCWLVVPVYFLGRSAFNRGTGLVAAALATALPTLAEVTADAISDATFLAFNITALALAQRGLLTNRWQWWLATGIVGGIAYLVRPEGLLIAISGTIALVMIGVRHQGERRAAILGWIALAIGYGAIAGPYIVTIGGVTNKPSASTILNEVSEGNRSEPLFAVFVIRTDGSRILTGAKLAVTEPFRAANYGIGVLGLIGAVVLRKNRAAVFLLLQAGLSFLLLGVLGAKLGYVSRRHALTIAVIACVFAAAFLKWWAENACKYERRSFAIAVLILLAVSYPFGFRQLHPNRAGHRLAGFWVAENVPADVEFVDPFTWSEFFAGRSYRGFPNADHNRKFSKDVIYALIEPNNPTPSSEMPSVPWAQALAAKGELVYQWPPDGSGKNAVAVYKTPMMPR